ncbi:tonB-system energizer ExbB [Chromobacterium sp. Panama]|uniref:tonB-system energizer ExbB n=1 Tax=Chromobacterium sp. Panama TaxID=2161826 RepID=UPI001E621A29|nr:tonB-system energizer ExbB [Chromobacterium sp. Panama]
MMNTMKRAATGCALAGACWPLTALAEAGAAMPADLSALGMYRAADPVVKTVILGLLLAALACWVVLLVKGAALWRADRATGRALSLLGEAATLSEARAGCAAQPAHEPARGLLAEADAELRLSSPGAPRDSVQARAGFRLEQWQAEQGRRLAAGIGLLATIGAVAPFVGLFGTVWGIMNSFVGIARSGSSSLATVAPGIAEALLATAVGLVAAIPAVVIYNLFSRALARHKGRSQQAAGLALLLLSRELDVRAETV